MTSSTVVTLSGQIAKLLISEPSDSAQLADLASALNVMREAIRDEEAIQRIDWLLQDLEFFACSRAREELESAANERFVSIMRRRAR